MTSTESGKTSSRRENYAKAESTKNVKPVRERKVSLAVSATVLGEVKPEDISKGSAYAFTKGGKLLGRADLDSKGNAKLEVNLPELETTQQLRILIGPRLQENISIREVLRLGGEQSFVEIEPKVSRKDVSIQVVPPQVLCWLLSLCAVQGKVMKKVVSGGIPIDLPVCNATVEIYEVDPIYLLIPRLPDLIIEEIRDFIIRPPPPPPPPIEEYEHAFSIGPLPPQPLRIGAQVPRQLSSSGEKSNIEMAAATYSLDRSYAEVSPSVETMLAGEDMQKLRVLANATSTEQFRQVLINYAVITKFIFCRFPHIIPHMDLVATAKTAECGKFKAIFFRGCNNPDTPDLYFRVKQKVFVFLPPLTIYNPTPVLCHTYWNYKCGTPVTLFVTSPLARTCSPCQNVEAPENWVLFQAIGNLHLNEIRGTSTDNALVSTTTTANVGLAAGDAPFGEILRPRIEFDNSLSEVLGVKYYQVSYRKGTSGQFTAITGQIDRHYEHMVDSKLVEEVYNLGPKQGLATPNLFLIPPALPPTGQWLTYDAVEDTASAKFDTRKLAALQAPGDAWPASGLYQFKVDLFDASGNLVDIDALNIKFRVPELPDSLGNIPTEDAAATTLTNDGIAPFTGLVQDDDSDGKRSMIIALYLDNSYCKADIMSPELDTVVALEACGVMRYKMNKDPQGSVKMDYRPTHPLGVGAKGFAHYQFEVIRGANTAVIPAVPFPGLDTPFPPATLSETRDVKDLLGECEIAGFAEHLHVYAKATSGWRRLWEYDAEKVTGFALAPETKPHGPPSP